MRELSRAGNTVVVVEHDPTIVRACDRVLELGPGAGSDGGRILFDGTPAELAKRTRLADGRGVGARESRAVARAPHAPSAMARRARRARTQPPGASTSSSRSGVVCAVTGPSGSGKSTLVHDVSLPRRRARPRRHVRRPRPALRPAGSAREGLARAVLVDQSPLGRTARGNPATYIKAWDRVRARFAAEPEAQRRGLTSAHFSFNVAAGPLRGVRGRGLRDRRDAVPRRRAAPVPVCQGKRFKPEVLAVQAPRPERRRRARDDRRRGAASVFGRDDAADRAARARAASPRGARVPRRSGSRCRRSRAARRSGSSSRAPSASPRRDALHRSTSPAPGCTPRTWRTCVARCTRWCDAGASVVVVEHDLDVDPRVPTGSSTSARAAARTGGASSREGTPERSLARRQRGPARRCAAGGAGGRRPAARARARQPILDSAWPHRGRPRARAQPARTCRLRSRTGKLCVVTGPSGSGKISLAFDVVFAEGQRRFVETLTPYARQFLPTLPRPDVDAVDGRAARRSRSSSARRAAAPNSHGGHRHRGRALPAPALRQGRRAALPEVRRRADRATSSPDALCVQAREGDAGAADAATRPAVRARKGTYLDVFTAAARAGVGEARVDGGRVGIDPPPRLTKTQGAHDRPRASTRAARGARPREPSTARCAWGKATSVRGSAPPNGTETLLSTARTCPTCGTGVPELDPRWFSFNTKQGGCEACEGTGVEGGAEAAAEGEQAPCSACGGSRLQPIPRARAAVRERATTRWSRESVSRALQRVRAGTSAAARRSCGDAALAELLRRLEFVERGGPRLPGARPARRHPVRRRDAAAAPCGAARQRASPAPSTSWTSRPSACTRGTPAGCWRTSAAWCAPARRWWWWSTMRTPSARPTISSTSGRPAAGAAGALSPRARRPRCLGLASSPTAQALARPLLLPALRAAGDAVARVARRPGQQPAPGGRAAAARPSHRRRRRLRQREKHPRPASAFPRRARRTGPCDGATRPLHHAVWPRGLAPRAGGGPVAHRPHPAQRAGHLPRGVG